VARASDDTREQAVAVLRRGLLQGRLGTETFIGRVDAAYQAKTHDELASVTQDLPRHRAFVRNLLERFLPAAEAAQQPVPLQPPSMGTGETRVLGRDAACDYSIADPTVSNRHAELVLDGDCWVIRDLGSRNGTRVNGWLVKEERLRPGDILSLGARDFVFRP
jgi:FHA domain/DUF1707 SHOCT-like domain